MADTLKVKVNGQSRELFMSFGLLNEIAKLIEDIDNIGLIAVNPDLREKVLSALLSERDEDGNISKPFNFITAKMSVDEANKILDFAADNVCDFFLKLLEGTSRLQQKIEPKVRDLMSSLAGSENSASKTPSAGPST